MLTVTVPVIRSQEDLAEAMERMQALWGAAPGTPEGDELDVLGLVISDYEKKHTPPMPELTGRDLVEHLMDLHHLSQAELPEIGNQSVVSLVLRGQRAINLRMAKALSQRFAVPVTAFLE